MTERSIIHVITYIGGKFYDIKGIFDESGMEDFNDIEGLVGKKLSDMLKVINPEVLTKKDMFNNYSFEFRGPIL